MDKLKLCFFGKEDPQLESTVFKHPVLASQLVTCRGKMAGPFTGHGTFQWSSAVRALSCLMLLSASWAKKNRSDVEYPPRLQGEKKSFASSLDYALGKQPNWLLDMFGVSARGHAYARRLIHRSNPERRRAGPVTLSLNTNFLKPENIQVFWEREEITGWQQLESLADRIVKHSPDMEFLAEFSSSGESAMQVEFVN